MVYSVEKLLAFPEVIKYQTMSPGTGSSEVRSLDDEAVDGGIWKEVLSNGKHSELLWEEG